MLFAFIKKAQTSKCMKLTILRDYLFAFDSQRKPRLSLLSPDLLGVAFQALVAGSSLMCL